MQCKLAFLLSSDLIAEPAWSGLDQRPAELPYSCIILRACGQAGKEGGLHLGRDGRSLLMPYLIELGP